MNNLRFADDIVLIGVGREEIQKMMRELIRVSGEALNHSKSLSYKRCIEDI